MNRQVWQPCQNGSVPIKERDIPDSSSCHTLSRSLQVRGKRAWGQRSRAAFHHRVGTEYSNTIPTVPTLARKEKAIHFWGPSEHLSDLTRRLRNKSCPLTGIDIVDLFPEARWPRCQRLMDSRWAHPVAGAVPVLRRRGSSLPQRPVGQRVPTVRLRGLRPGAARVPLQPQRAEWGRRESHCGHQSPGSFLAFLSNLQ